MRDRGGEFRRGLRASTPLVLLAAALTVAMALWGVQALVSDGAFTVVPEDRIVRIPNDDYAHVSYRVAELRRHPPAGPVVYLLGGSGTLELARSEASLGDAVSADAGRRVPVVNLAAQRQSMGQTLAIVDNLPPGDGLLAVGLDTRRLTTAPSEDAGQLVGRPLALTSPALASVLAGRTSIGGRLPGILPGILEFSVSYLKQRASLTRRWLRSVPYAHHYYGDGPVASLACKRAVSREELAYEEPRFRRYAAYNLDVLAEIVRLARERGFSVVFFEQPLGPKVSRPGWDSFLADYRARVSALAWRLRVPHVDVQSASGVRLRDFADLFHLVNSGRDKWTAPFARALAKVLVAEGIVPATREPS